MANPRDPLVLVLALQEKVRQRTVHEKRDLPLCPATPRKVVQLPFWPEPVRGVPNGVLRSALFGAIKRGSRRYLDGEHITSLDGIEIHYTGQRLDQGDLDVWETVLHIARRQELGEQCRFTAYAMLKLLGKADSGDNRKTLHTRLMRLKATAVEIKQSGFTHIGSLIAEADRNDSTHEYIIKLNPKLRTLFEPDQFTQIDWKVRQALNGKPLAQWLHGFYASHAKPYPFKVETLHKLCGSEAELRRFRQTLGDALNILAKISNAHEQPFSYDIRSDLVYIEKQPSGSQRRYLAKQKAIQNTVVTGARYRRDRCIIPS